MTDYSRQRERLFNAYLASSFASSLLRAPDDSELPRDLDPRIHELQERLIQCAQEAAELAESLGPPQPPLRIV